MYNGIKRSSKCCACACTQVLHFADEVHSVYMHWPKAYMAPSSWGMNVDKDCAFIAHFDTHFDTLDWDGVFENAA